MLHVTEYAVRIALSRDLICIPHVAGIRLCVRGESLHTVGRHGRTSFFNLISRLFFVVIVVPLNKFD